MVDLTTGGVLALALPVPAPGGGGLWASSFMRFPPDVAFLDHTGLVLRTASAVPPSRIVLGGPRARIALELPPGMLTRAGAAPGHRLALHVPAGADDSAYRCRCVRVLMGNARQEGPHA